MPKKKNKELFIMLPREVINSYAWRAASGDCHKWVYRIAEEHLAHGLLMNGQLKVTQKNVIEYAIRKHDNVAPAMREALALGLIILTEPRKIIRLPVPPVRTETGPPCEGRKVANAE
jgi:hypothetical protein